MLQEEKEREKSQGVRAGLVWLAQPGKKTKRRSSLQVERNETANDEK